jgi:hypothetical protein
MFLFNLDFFTNILMSLFNPNSSADFYSEISFYVYTLLNSLRARTIKVFYDRNTRKLGGWSKAKSNIYEQGSEPTIWVE